MPGKDAPHASVGAVVRERRERSGLSMEELAHRAGLGRSTIHRIEHGLAIEPRPSNLAKVLKVLGLQSDEADLLLSDAPERWRDEVLNWMQRGSALTIDAQGKEVDLLALHPDGTVIAVEVRVIGVAVTTHLSAVQSSLKAAGMLVTRPV